jgi:tripartite-type tricarboxylate transporter receptor subunit TctC
MKTNSRLSALCALLVAASLTAVGPATAQQYPVKPIKLVLGVPAGTTTDLGARLFTTQMGPRLGQPIIVESRPGANLTIAANYTAKSDPDGYTLFYSPAFVFNPVFVKNNPVDASKEFAAVSLVSSTEYLMFATGKLPITNWKEAIAWARANPGKLNFGSVAPGFDLMMNMLSQAGGFTYASIPYAGSALVAPPLITGDVHLSISSPAVFQSFIAAGTIRPLFSTGRSAVFPTLPTAGETGFADLDDIRLNFYFWAPQKTPQDIVQRLSAAVAYAAKLPEVIEQHRKLFGVDPIGTTPDETKRIVERELGAWSRLARQANFQPQ